MFVVEKLNNGIATGYYFKRGNIRSRWDSKLVDKDNATIFRSMSGVLNCLGDYIPIKDAKRRPFSKRVLDTTKWKVHKVYLHDDSLFSE